jgi:hypothetical protein
VGATIMLTIARKNRKCDYCGNQILAGERYEALRIKKSVGYKRFMQKSYHLKCFEQYQKDLLKSNIEALRNMSPSSKNICRIRSDNE